MKAGANATRQLRVLLRSSSLVSADPFLVLRCQLFLAMSLGQTGQVKKASRLVRFVHGRNRTGAKDPKLDNMCRGVWARLRHKALVGS